MGLDATKTTVQFAKLCVCVVFGFPPTDIQLIYAPLSLSPKFPQRFPMYIYIYIYTHVYLYTYIQTCVYRNIRTYSIYLYTYTRTTCVYIYIYIHIFVGESSTSKGLFGGSAGKDYTGLRVCIGVPLSMVTRRAP